MAENSTVHSVVPSEELSGHSDDEGDLPEHPSGDDASTSSSSEERRSTTSLSKENIEQIVENGRRYANFTYYMPNDEAEETRLNIFHQLYLLILDGRVTKAPIRRDVKRILDVGAGTGDWAIGMAELFPHAQIIATDINMFDMTSLPPNVSFQIDDAEDEWTFTEPFDLIHIRGMMGAFDDWDQVYCEAYEHLKDGGILEISDYDSKAVLDSVSGPYTNMLASALISAADESGRPYNINHLKRSALEAAGFSDIRTTTINVPIGTWPTDPRVKTMGKMWLICVLEGLEAWGLRLLTRHMGWKTKDFRDLCNKVKRELMEPKNEGCTSFHFVLAQKHHLETTP
ncbi:MAG: hypothetical protein M1834_000189 [Cirrosporium novae-zelandiae]|nr:MAG: hypothetical protein M1834_000189 [Cirrosporium novae-zelandiae]